MDLTKKSILKIITSCALCCAAMTVLSCGNDAPDSPEPEPTPTPTPTPTPVESSELRIMSFNIRTKTDSDTGDKSWDSRKPAIVSMIKDQRPDVICGQEFNTPQRPYMKEELPEYAMIEIPGTGSTGGNDVLMYRKDRFELVESGYFWLSDTPDTPSKSFSVGDNKYHCSVWATLKDKLSDTEFVAMGTHFPVRTNSSYDNTAYIEARLKSAELCLARMRGIAGNDKMCFLMGDMNQAWKTSKGEDNADGQRILGTIKAWMKEARTEVKDNTPSGVTSYNSYGSGAMNPNRIIDHIFYRNAEGIDFTTITKSYNNIRYISDHYPIMLRVKLPVTEK